MTNKRRPIDTMARKNYSWWGKSFVFIEKTKIKTWQAIFIIAFISGAALTLVWTISNNWHPFSEAAVVANPIELVIAQNPVTGVMFGNTRQTVVAQSFKATSSQIAKVSVALFKQGSPTQKIKLAIKETVAGPDLVSQEINPPLSTNMKSPSWVTADFASALAVTPGKTYLLVLSVAQKSAVNFYQWSIDTYNPYAGGRFYESWSGSLKESSSGYDGLAKISFGQPITCTDSDGGIKYYVKGNVTTNYNGQDPQKIINDSCIVTDTSYPGQKIGVSGCTGNACEVEDFYCIGTSGPYGSFFTCPNGCEDGACITQASAGSYSVYLDPSTPSGRLVVAGTIGNTMLIMRFKAVNEPVKVNKVKLGIIGKGILLPASPSDIERATIYDGATLLGSGIFGSYSSITINLNSPIIIPAGTEKVINIKIDLAKVGTGEPGIAGDSIIIRYSGSEGTGQNSGVALSDSSILDSTYVYIFKSIPTISKMTLPTNTLANGAQTLFRFVVTANNQGNIDWNKATFNIGGTVKVSNLTLVNVGYGKTIYYKEGDVLNGIDTDLVFSEPQTIVAGNGVTFELRGIVSSSTIGSILNIKMRADAPTISGKTAAQINAEASNNFIWSDMSKSPHSLMSLDWINGSLIPGFSSYDEPEERLTK